MGRAPSSHSRRLWVRQQQPSQLKRQHPRLLGPLQTCSPWLLLVRLSTMGNPCRSRTPSRLVPSGPAPARASGARVPARPAAAGSDDVHAPRGSCAPAGRSCAAGTDDVFFPRGRCAPTGRICPFDLHDAGGSGPHADRGGAAGAAGHPLHHGAGQSRRCRTCLRPPAGRGVTAGAPPAPYTRTVGPPGAARCRGRCRTPGAKVLQV